MILRKPLLMIGSSGHASVVTDIIEQQRIYELVGFVEDFKAPGDDFIGYPILNNLDHLEEIIASTHSASLFVAIGDNCKRAQVVETINSRRLHVPFATVVHPSAQIARTATIGEGTVIAAGVVISSLASAGRFCIIGARTSLGHHSRLQDFSSLAPGATVGAHVEVGECSAISLGATVIEKIRIGKNTVIGAGATVVNNIGSNVVAYGVPATVRRKRSAGEPYLR